MQILGLGTQRYCSDNYNLFDAAVTILGVIEMSLALSGAQGSGLSALRALRLLRLFRLAKSWKSLNRMIKVMLTSIKSVAWLTVLLILFIFMAGLLGMIVSRGLHAANKAPFLICLLSICSSLGTTLISALSLVHLNFVLLA